jgi:hypothetical protein
MSWPHEAYSGEALMIASLIASLPAPARCLRLYFMPLPLRGRPTPVAR